MNDNTTHSINKTLRSLQDHQFLKKYAICTTVHVTYVQRKRIFRVNHYPFEITWGGLPPFLNNNDRSQKISQFARSFIFSQIIDDMYFIKRHQFISYKHDYSECYSEAIVLSFSSVSQSFLSISVSFQRIFKPFLSFLSIFRPLLSVSQIISQHFQILLQCFWTIV